MEKKYIALLCVTCLAVGFYVGREMIPYKEEIRYVQGEVVRDTTFHPVPLLEIVHDTIILVERDTIKTLIDWNTERYYAEQLFNDKRGILDVSASVQYNRLQDISFEFVPVYREITRYKIPAWHPYVGFSYNTFNQVAFDAGLFYKHFGIELQYISNFKQKGYGIGLRYKF